jgi:hypothetical protein
MKIYPLIQDPDKKVYKVEKISKFAKEHNLDSGALSKLFNGKQNTHKGWKLADDK